MSDQTHDGEAPGLLAVQQVLEVAQRTAIARLRLHALDLKDAASSGARTAAWGTAGITAILLGWVLLLGAATAALSQLLVPWAALACVGFSQCLVGAALLAVARRARPPVLP
jgi:hypothetical protein